MSTIAGKRALRWPQPLNVFALPPDLLDQLTVRNLHVQPHPAPFSSVSTTATANDDTTGPPISSNTSSDTLSFSTTTAQADRASGGLSCGICPGAFFEDVEEQRAHFKDDWHRYNVRAKMTAASVGGGPEGVQRKVKKGTPLSLEDFESMVDDLSSISGSESAGSNTSTTGRDQVTNLLRKQRLDGPSSPRPVSDSEGDSEDEAFLRNRAALRTALVYFTVPPTPISPNTAQFGVYRALFPSYLTNPADFLPCLRDLQLTESDAALGEDGERRWVLLMVAGGHFAGMVVALGGKRTGKKVIKGDAGEVRVLRHKTFHRYTTRKKQGGSQSKHDQGNGPANSIGAQMRRAGEMMLNDEIRDLLESWADDFNVAERVFVRANDSGRKTFWGYEGAVIAKDDERIRTFPFPTRRPTLSELLRCYHELTRVKTSFHTEEALAAMEAAYVASLKPKISRPIPVAKPSTKVLKPAVPKLSDEEERARERWRRLLEIIRKGRLEALATFWDKWASELELDSRGELPHWLWEEDRIKEGTLLQVAAVAGQEDVVRWLLDEKDADPTVPVPTALCPSGASGESSASPAPAPSAFRTAYDLSPNRAIRSVFRRSAHARPARWDWTSTLPGGARVPSGLSAEMEEEQDKKKTERRKGLKEKMREREARKPDIESSPAPEPRRLAVPTTLGTAKTGPQRLGGGADGNSARAGGEGLNGLSPEVRARIERERRARAAEARMAASR